MSLSALLLPHVSAQAAVKNSVRRQTPLPASDKSAPSNQSAISRAGRGSASPFHISYFISHNFLRPQGATLKGSKK